MRPVDRATAWWCAIAATVLGTACDDIGKSDTGDDAGEVTLTGFIGSPCSTDADCPYSGGFCLEAGDGLPDGMCSAECDQYCDDLDGHPTTFCVSRSALPRKAQSKVTSGACVSRCNYGDYPDGGCRSSYGCQEQSRYQQPSRKTYACLPGSPDASLPRCYQDLADRGVAFEADIRPPDSLSGSSRSCTIEDAVWLERNVLGTRLVYEPDLSVDTTLAKCSLGLALADTIEELHEHDVTAVYHLGTYACRTVSGTSTLSRHAYGDAIDISGFQFANGQFYSVAGDWEHNTTNFRTAAGAWMYERGRLWHLQNFWSVVLTPNFNAAHDDHFHIDLTPGNSYWARETAASEPTPVPAGYFGPAPYAD